MSVATQPGPVAVLGAGSWGTALALTLAGSGRAVRLWGHDPAHVARLATAGENPVHLPGLRFPASLRPMSGLAETLAGAGDLVLAVPFGGLDALLGRLAPLAAELRITISCKGIEPHTGRLAHDIARDHLGADAPLAVLSGPTFARELAAGAPTAAVVASTTPGLAPALVDMLHTGTFRVYSGEDVIGVELGGALKNVLAIAAGISDGLGFGANARAALITRGLAEITRMGLAMGAAAETFAGLAGVGDIVLTCTDDQSRNRRLGLALAEGLGPAEAIARIGQVTEGVPTAAAAVALSQRHGVEMPLASQVARILDGRVTAAVAVRELLSREPGPEQPGAR